MDIEGVVLAAGSSSRAGVYKLSLDIMNKTIIERCIESMYEVCSKIIVVGGYKFEEISELLSKYSKVKVIYNPNYKDEMISSVKEGIKHVRAERFFLIPGDHPIVTRETYEKMSHRDNDIVVAEYKGRKGHPVLIRTSVTKEFFNNLKYTNLNEFIHAHGYTTIETEDPGVLIDIDTIEDYKGVINDEGLLKGISMN